MFEYIDDEATVELWLEATKKLAEVKKEELRLRNQLINSILNGEQHRSERAWFGEFELRATPRINLNLDIAAYMTMEDQFSPREKDCLEWKPSISAKKFNTLPKNSKLRKCVTEKPGQGSLKIVN